ncbi:MAG: lysophospholipid acyltransferase family protein [Oceanococcus sp.]
MINTLFWIFSHTPLRLAAGFSWAFAWLWWTVLPIRKKLAVQGYHRAFPEQAAGPHLRQMFAGVILGYFELFREMRVPGSVQVEYINSDAIQKDVERGQGTFLLGGHFGSWDLISSMTCRDMKFPVSVTVKTPKNAKAAALIERIRTAFGMGLLPTHNCMPRIYEEIEQGHMVAFLLDMRFNRGVSSDFFGHPARTSPGLPTAAFKSGAPVHTVWFVRTGIGRHQAVFGPPLEMTGDLDADIGVIQAYYEERIRAAPHNWFWLHDRWR